MAAPMRCLSVIQRSVFRIIKKRVPVVNELKSYPLYMFSSNSNRHFHCHCVMMQKITTDAMALKKMMESLTDKFVEARELLGDAASTTCV